MKNAKLTWMGKFKSGKNKLPDPKDSNAVRNHIKEKYVDKKYKKYLKLGGMLMKMNQKSQKKTIQRIRKKQKRRKKVQVKNLLLQMMKNTKKILKKIVKTKKRIHKKIINPKMLS